MPINMKNDNKIIFFGTSEFAVPALKALINEGYDVVLVITQPDKPVGRKQVLTPTPVKIEAQKQNLEIWEGLKNLKLKIESLKPALGIVAAYGKIIPKKILDIPPKGCLNIHPSLLPKYRGASPIQTAILNGDKITGISIIKLDGQMDHGPIISKSQISIFNNDTSESLHHKLSVEGAALLVKTLPDYISDKITPVIQDDSKSTCTKILKREDGKIDWDKSAIEVGRQTRAYYPWPGSFAEVKIKNSKLKIKILSVKVNYDIGVEIGQLQNNAGHLIVQCGKGSLIIEKLQPEGKKEMSSKEFINGYMR